MFYYTVVHCLPSRLALYIPTAKAGGFTALLGKKSRVSDLLSSLLRLVSDHYSQYLRADLQPLEILKTQVSKTQTELPTNVLE
jgi:hypothetical protein